MRKFCEQEGKPTFQTVNNWLLKHKDFFEQYARAKALRASFYEEECVDIADDGRNDKYLDNNGNTRTDWDVVKRSELRIRTRQWCIERIESKVAETTGGQTVVINLHGSARPARYDEKKSGTKDE